MARGKSEFQHRLEQSLVACVARLGSRLAQRLSLRTLRRIAEMGARVVIALTSKRQRLADANIAAAFPELSQAERDRIRLASVRNICLTMLEMLKLPAITPSELRQLIPLEADIMRENLQERGVIILTAHYGNWEWLGARLAQEAPVTVIARDAAHDVTASLINNARESHGVTVIGRDDLRRMLSVLNHKEILGILPDQHALQGGVLLDFLGRPAWTFTGPALFAARTGAIVLPVFCVRQPDDSFVVEMMPPLDLVDSGDREADLLENTRTINEVISEAIRRHPEQWLWLHNRWKMKSGQDSAQ